MNTAINYEANAILSTVEYRVVGKRPVRHDGADKVTGKARYGADMGLPGMLYSAILRSPHAHARIVSIDTSRAAVAAAVKAVVTAADFSDPGPAPGSFQLLNLMARDKVHYKGHALAAVAAMSPQAAWDALELIRVEYEPLPGVRSRRLSRIIRRRWDAWHIFALRHRQRLYRGV